MKPITYRARDGLLLHGYLTLPASGPQTNPPLVNNPHGGPWVRDSRGFDPEVQFLANRGYAVLRVNFRGSSGYGLSFLRAGDKQRGRKMQDDLTDGVKWAIAQGARGGWSSRFSVLGILRMRRLKARGNLKVGLQRRAVHPLCWARSKSGHLLRRISMRNPRNQETGIPGFLAS